MNKSARTVCIIGAGPIRIGQACEFDYSGVQGVQALKQDGHRVVLVNSNPATIMTDPSIADATYIEPITPEAVEAILKAEHCDALLPTLGGQTALNVAVGLAQRGALERLGVEMLGVSLDTIRTAEDRELFRNAMKREGLPVLPAVTVNSPEAAERVIEEIGLPAVLRPSFTLGGTGGLIVHDPNQLSSALSTAIRASPVGQVLVERSVVGWKEYELEVMRDRAGTFIVVCSIENVDAMGVHTGDSITVAPAMTLSDKEYQVLRDAAAKCLQAVALETGGANVQFAVHPTTGEWVVIEMNPRVSRSSALASKATGVPIARIAARLAMGWRLDELTNAVTGTTPSAFEPALDYVVVKIPRFAFEKFRPTADTLGTSMKSVGEAMAIGTCFEEALLKAVRSLELGRHDLSAPQSIASLDRSGLVQRITTPNPDRLWAIAHALRSGWTPEQVRDASGWDLWFVDRIAALVKLEHSLELSQLTHGDLLFLKRSGVSDAAIAQSSGVSQNEVWQKRNSMGVVRRYRKVDTCAGEFEAITPYLFGGFEQCDEVPERKAKSVIVLGSGPIRIGQGIEFDACCVHAVAGLREEGREAVMVNCNPETVSTDWDTADRLYFEPLTLEEVRDIARREECEGVLVQFGGQTPLKIAAALQECGVPILGTAPAAIHLSEDRRRFASVLERLKLRQPDGATVTSLQQALDALSNLKGPVLVRPSYVLGGRGMQIVFEPEDLIAYWKREVVAAPEFPVLIDKFLERAVEIDVDVLADRHDAVICGVLEHIEEAGVHSGDSSCVVPSVSLSLEVHSEVRRIARLLARELEVVGLLNVQLAVRDGVVYVLEANPRASRTVPFISKASGTPWASLAARLCCGARIRDLGIRDGVSHGIAVKMPVFPWDRFSGVDPVPGPEMRSTGEVMGLGLSFGEAYAKAAIAAGWQLPLRGCVFLSLTDNDKGRAVPLGARFEELGFEIVATAGTAEVLESNGIAARVVNKISMGSPHAMDMMRGGEIQLVINTASGLRARRDGMAIRRGAIELGIPYVGTIPGGFAIAEAIASLRLGDLSVTPLQYWYAASSLSPNAFRAARAPQSR